jgi:hypothetical protein
VFLNINTKAAQGAVTLFVAIFAGNSPPTLLGLFSLLAIFGGVVYASSEFNTAFIAGMACNLSFSLRGVNRIKWYDATPANHFSVITLLSFLLMIPVTFLLEGE